MRTLQRQRKRAASDNDDSDEENQPPAEDRPIKKTRRSLAKADSSSLSSDFTDIKEMLRESERRQEAVNKEMVETLRENTRVYERTSDKYLEVLLQLARSS